MQENESGDDLSPIQRIHVFFWNIYNIIRNINALRQWLRLRYPSTAPSYPLLLPSKSSDLLEESVKRAMTTLDDKYKPKELLPSKKRWLTDSTEDRDDF